MHCKIKICKADFLQTKRMWNEKIAQNLSLKILALNMILSKLNFIIGCMVGFQLILTQKEVFTTLDENWISHALHLSARSCEAIKLFYDIFLVLGLNSSLNVQSLKLRQLMAATYTKEIWRLSSAEVVFVTSWGCLRHFCTRDKYWHVAGYRSAHY